MDCIQAKNITFAYLHPDAPEDHRQRTVDDLVVVFEDFSLTIPSGLVSLIGPNGVGKSTLMLMLAARVEPHRGDILIGKYQSRALMPQHVSVEEAPLIEVLRSLLVGIVYQNMEFESPASCAELIEQVLTQGAWGEGAAFASRLDSIYPRTHTPDQARIVEHIQQASTRLELHSFLGRSSQNIAKGELQRLLIVLAAAYGSRILVMDEPVFAMEDRHKHACFAWLREYCELSGATLLFSAHDFQLCTQYADTMILLGENGTVHIGPPSKIGQAELIESVYKVPMSTLYQREALYRSMLETHQGKKT